MKKYIIGGLIGFALATAASANAEGVTKLIDQVVQGVFPVSVDGKSVGDAIVVDNKTYLPVRDFGEAVGYKVSFSEEREVILTKNETSTETSTPPPTSNTNNTPDQTLAKKVITGKIEYYRTSINMANLSITAIKEDIRMNPERKDEFEKKITELTANITEYEAQIADYEQQLAALQAQQ